MVNHKEAVHKSISTFKDYKANKTVDLNIDKEHELHSSRLRYKFLGRQPGGLEKQTK